MGLDPHYPQGVHGKTNKQYSDVLEISISGALFLSDCIPLAFFSVVFKQQLEERFLEQGDCLNERLFRSLGPQC